MKAGVYLIFACVCHLGFTQPCCRSNYEASRSCHLTEHYRIHHGGTQPAKDAGPVVRPRQSRMKRKKSSRPKGVNILNAAPSVGQVHARHADPNSITSWADTPALNAIAGALSEAAVQPLSPARSSHGSTVAPSPGTTNTANLMVSISSPLTSSPFLTTLAVGESYDGGHEWQHRETFTGSSTWHRIKSRASSCTF